MTSSSQKIRIHTISLGCPKNRVDTESMLGSMLSSIEAVEHPEEADIVLINTCGFIEPAVKESVQTILATASALAELEPKPLLVVTGCLVMRYKDELARELPEVDLFLTIPEQHQLPAWITRMLQQTIPEEQGRALSTSPGYGYLKISEGCNNTCRFCIIPSLRGRLVSQPVETVVNQAKELLARGVKELVLIAQDVTAYGRDLGITNGLETLLERLLPLDGLEWLRLMYLYPAGLTDERLAFLAQCGPPLLPYLDIPFQHSHPDILRSMGRPFMHDTRAVVDRIRSYLPDAAIRTTLIVGYPGETEAHFEHLVQTVQDVRFDHLGVFTFFPEQGTPAAAMPNQVSQDIKEARKARLMEIQATISQERLTAYEDTVQPVLVDEPSPEWEGLFVGRTWFQAPEVDGITYISGPNVEPGRLIQARIHETKTYDLVALT